MKQSLIAISVTMVTLVTAIGGFTNFTAERAEIVAKHEDLVDPALQMACSTEFYQHSDDTAAIKKACECLMPKLKTAMTSFTGEKEAEEAFLYCGKKMGWIPRKYCEM